MSAADDALDVAMLTVCRWRDPRFSEWSDDAQLVLAETYCKNREWVAAAERVLVERGLGEKYGRALRLALLIEDAAKDRRGQYLTDGEIAAIRTAPLEVCLRALARVVREKQPKEKA